jgi:hypothetical protein
MYHVVTDCIWNRDSSLIVICFVSFQWTLEDMTLLVLYIEMRWPDPDQVYEGERAAFPSQELMNRPYFACATSIWLLTRRRRRTR